MKAIATLAVGLACGLLLGRSAAAVQPWHLYTVRTIQDSPINYKRGYAAGVMDTIGFIDPGGETAWCMMHAARTPSEVWAWSRKVWSTSATTNQSAAGALIMDSMDGCRLGERQGLR